MKDNFKLESFINDMLKTSEDLYDLFDIKYQDGHLEESVTNALLGIIEMHKIRYEKLHNEFVKVFELDEYCQDAGKLMARTKLFTKLDFPMSADVGFVEPKKPAKKTAKKKAKK
jgi:hypothetical protein